jgi:hypothetical protein
LGPLNFLVPVLLCNCGLPVLYVDHIRLEEGGYIFLDFVSGFCNLKMIKNQLNLFVCLKCFVFGIKRASNSKENAGKSAVRGKMSSKIGMEENSLTS